MLVFFAPAEELHIRQISTITMIDSNAQIDAMTIWPIWRYYSELMPITLTGV